MSLYVIPKSILEKYKGKLNHLNLSKRCIRFKRLDDLPLDVVHSMLEKTIILDSSGWPPVK